MVKKLLAELEFSSIIGESQAQTATGQQILDKYKSIIMVHESSCTLVNNFITEASQCMYDNGVHAVLEKVTDYVQMNKTSWALSSVCESIKNGKSSYNYLSQTAVGQVEKLLENDEDTVTKYIKAGALKNVMYVTEFRNIAKQVFHDTPMVESSAEYTMTRPISFVESNGDGYTFEAAGHIITVSADKTISEGSWNDVSNTFRVITSLLESQLCMFDEVSEGLTINYNDVEYFINEVGKCKRGDKEMTVEQLRDQNRLVVMSTNPRFTNQVAQVLEAIALTCENFDHVAKMDNAGICETNSDKFLIVCEGTNMFSTLIKSNHSGIWTYNSNVVETLENIKKSTRVSLSESFTNQVKLFIDESSIEDKERMEREIKESEKNTLKERIEVLTEQFKNDPVKLAVLSKVAQDLQTIEG